LGSGWVGRSDGRTPIRAEPTRVEGERSMGFLSGRITCVRFRVSGDSPLPFDEEHLEKVSQHAIGRHGSGDPTDGVFFGWNGGNHVLDMTFDLGKNVVNDALHLGMRIDA